MQLSSTLSDWFISVWIDSESELLVNSLICWFVDLAQNTVATRFVDF